MIEQRLCKNIDGLALKFTSPGNVGVPDRIILRPIPEEHREIVARYVEFVEVKRPGERPRPKQQWWLDRLCRLGYKAWWTDEA